ncbi:PREDICTED: uncharacterized protein LOC109343600 isoform X2 [Lupinus angustifolius]|uniref:uncharacterized protein LOC109343600 isoform X2 n=1 Tax=Lupinus angustifolius TaxID=3871 RepID=UPI00092F3F0E|nr:PREDICTED: uncharacterized protein LOC109343600 isoform X2 [Lupinus angustifolius]
MPSGAKKRKAAKKKKEKGNDELKFHDEKGNDDGKGGSPSHHDYDDDNDNDHPFNEGNEDVEESDPSAAQPSAADAESVEEVPSDVKIGEAPEGKQDVVLERDLKSGESFEGTNLSLVHVESAEESDFRNGNSNAGLNDETAAENAKEEPDNSVNEEVTFDEIVKSIDSSHTKMTSIFENAPVGETDNSVLEPPIDPVKAVASISEVKSSDTGSALPEKSVDSLVGPIDLAVKKNEDKVHPGSYSAQHVDDSDTQESSENQPLVASAPRVVQKASWLNCCGLFEVLTGSGR